MMSIKEKKGGKQRIPEKTGAKSKYFTHIEPYLEAIAAMMRSGATIEIIAEKFKVSKPSIYDYQKKHVEFFNALKANAEIADFAVENALYQNAITGNLTAQIFWLKNRRSKQWRDKQHVFQASSTVVRKDYESMTEAELEKEMEMLDGVIPEDIDDIETDGGVH